MKRSPKLLSVLTGAAICANLAHAEVIPYVSALVEDSIMRLQDLNNDGDFNDANEATQFFGPGNADGWPGVGSAQTLLTLAFDDILAADGEESGNFDTRVYRLRNLNGDHDAMDTGEAIEFWDAMLPTGVNYDRPKDMTIGPDGAIYLADNNTINFDYDTPEAVWRLQDLNNDGDVNDPNEITLYIELAPAGDAFGFISEDFKWNATDQLIFSNMDSSTNTTNIWIIQPDQTLTPFLDDSNLFGIGIHHVGLTLQPGTLHPVMSAYDVFDIRRIIKFVDFNGNGYIDDNDEKVTLYRSDVAVESFQWNITASGPTDIDYAPDGTLWLTNNVDDLIFRFNDLNNDGDYNDLNEAAEVYRAAIAGANGGFATEFPRTITFASTAPPGDINDDGLVNPDDFLAFTDCMLGPDIPLHIDCLAANLDADHDADLDDLAHLQTLLR